jgi:hypothetical protein
VNGRGGWQVRCLVAAAIGPGCYHFAFEQRAAPPQAELVTFVERRPTYLNGFLGTGTIETSRYCRHPVSTELRVTAADVLLSAATLLIYTPHTLSVTCSLDEVRGAGSGKW